MGEVRDALPRGVARRPILGVLARRLAALREVARGRATSVAGGSADRSCARRFLAPRVGSWHDGDENLVRGFLDRRVGRDEDPRRAAARGLLDAADALARLRPRAETLWFYLWVLESIVEGLAPAPEPRARIPSVRTRTPGRS